MSRTAPVPFDPDLFGQVTPAKRPVEVAAPAMMLSQILAAQAVEPTPDTDHPDNLKGTAKPLDKDAKWKLSDLAKRTYDQLHKAGQIQEGEKLEAFRRRVSVKACGKRISQACHGDRKLIQAAFLALKGQTRQAARAVAKAALTPLEIARHKLWERIHELKLTPAYADSISRRYYKRTVAELTEPRKVWNILYTVNNNHNAATGKGSDANRFKSLKAKRANSKQTKSL